MTNGYTVAIHLKGRDELSGYLRQVIRCVDDLKAATQLSLVPMGKWARELEEAAQVAQEAIPETLKLADASKALTEVYAAQGGALRQAAEGSRQAAQAQAEQAKSLSEQLPGLFQKAIDASAEYRTQTKFVMEAATEGFKTFRKSTADGLENLFSVVFKGETEKFQGTWEKFTEKLKNDFLQMLGRIAAGMTQEVLLKPAMEWGEKALGLAASGLKSFLGLSEGGLVTKPTLGIIGEGGPELVIPLAA